MRGAERRSQKWALMRSGQTARSNALIGQCHVRERELGGHICLVYLFSQTLAHCQNCNL